MAALTGWKKEIAEQMADNYGDYAVASGSEFDGGEGCIVYFSYVPDADAVAAYKAWKESGSKPSNRTITEEFFDNFVTAETFYKGIHYYRNTKINEAMLDWLMEPCPQWWIDNLSDDQRSSTFGKAWSANRRANYEYPISRLEYWSVMWVPQTDVFSASSQLQAYMGVLAYNWDKEEYMHWNEKLRQYNRKEWEHARKIIQLVWGYYNIGGSSAKAYGTGNVRYDLYKKTEKFRPSERKFIEMLSLNQGKGPAWRDLFGPNNEGEHDYPWAVDENGVPIAQYIHVGSGTKDSDGNVIPPSDPVTHGILYKMLYTDDGYNTPFNPDNMSYIERVAMADRIRDADKKLTGEVSFTTAKRYLGQFTADTFLQKVLEYIKSDDAVQIWDGILRDDAGATNKVTMRVRGTGEENIFNSNTLGPAGEMAGKALDWAGRDTADETDRWDTGLFYWADATSTQFDKGVDAQWTGDRDATGMGAASLLYYLLPTPQTTDHWLKPGGNPAIHGNNGLFNEQYDFLQSLIAHDRGYMKYYNPNTGQTFEKGGSKKHKQQLFRINDSGFFDWEGMLSGEDETHVTNGGKGATYDNVKTILKNTAKTYIPDKITVNGKANTKPESFVLDWATDINSISPGKFKGTGNSLEPVTTNEKAKQLVKSVQEMFFKFAGSKANKRGPEVRQATAEWFTNNFGNQIVPSGLAAGTSFHAKIDISNAPADAQTALNNLLGSGYDLDDTSITFDKNNVPWMGAYIDGPREIPFDQILRTYQSAAYIAALYYRLARKNVDDVKLLVNDIWNHYAFKCAYHFYRSWEKILHDHQVGNLYALLCYVLAETDFTSEDALKALEALADLLGASDDDLMKQMEMADAPPQVEENPDPEANKEQRERFYKQCALLLNMDLLQFKYAYDGVMHDQSKKLGFTAYNGRIHMVTENGLTNGTRNTMLNKMISPSPQFMDEFINITPDKASKLLPYIRFFRVWHEDGELKEQEFNFPKNIERDKNGKIRIEGASPFDRGDGMGLTEFTWECDGETPATASKYIKAKAEFHFQTFNDFVKERTNQNGDPYRWVDMFVSPTSMVARGGPEANTPHTLKYDSEYYRIRVDVGYHTDADMPDALATQNRSFFLVLVDNEVSINEDMSVTIAANYRAYIEEAMDSNKFNALSTPELRAEMEVQKKQWDKATKAWKEGNCSDKQLRYVRNGINVQMEEIIKKQHKSIMKNMLDLERIFYVDFHTSDIAAFRQNGIFDKVPRYRNSSSHKLKPDDGAAARLKKLMEAKDDPKRDSWMEHDSPYKDERVYYFYLGDLIYLIQSSMYEGMQPWISAGPFGDTGDRYVSGAENHKLLLMDFEYHNTLAETDNSRRSINIAHIPISVDFFFQWYVNNIIKNETYHIGVGNFIKRILTELITEAMSEICMSSEEGHYTTFQHGSISVAGIGQSVPGHNDKQFIDPITGMLLLKKGTPQGQIFDVSYYYNKQNEFGRDLSLPFRFIPEQETLEEFDLNGVQGQFQYVYIYGDTKDPMHVGRGDEKKDGLRGCFHLHLGKNAGLVKNISFSKNNVPYLRESRMFNQGQAGLLQLSAVYDCEINMIGNTLFLPGQEVWVNPYGFGGDEFGKPQDPPLNWSPSTAEINEVNDNIRNRTKDGNFSDEEKAKTVAEVDALAAATDAKAETMKMKILSYANVMGIGGYQLIIRTKCTIKPGEFSTTITAKHVFSGYPTIKQSLNLAEFREGQPKPVSETNDTGGGNACEAIMVDWENKGI